MGIMIICVILIAIVVTSWLVCKFSKKYYYDESDTLGFTILTFLLSIPLCICIAIALSVQVYKDRDYEEMVYEKSVLELRLNNKDDNLVGNEFLYADIIDFNNKLRYERRYADNFWIGIFHNDKIATIEYIEIDGVENYKE